MEGKLCLCISVFIHVSLSFSINDLVCLSACLSIYLSVYLSLFPFLLFGVTTQMKALDECFLMVVFTLLMNRDNVFINFMFHLNRETVAVNGLVRLCIFTAVVGQSSR